MKKVSVYLILVLLAVISCKSPETNINIVTTATLMGPSSMAMIKMIAEEPVLDSSVQTKFIIRNEPNHVRAMILSKEVEFAVLPSTMAALLYNRNESYILAAVPVWGTLYLLGNDTSLTDWDDLKGKKISLMARGMTPDILFRFLASNNGLDPQMDFELDYSFPTHTELANALAAGIIDLAVISEPMISMVLKKNNNIRLVLDFNEEWAKIFGEEVPFAQTALLVKKEYAETHPEIVDQYLTKIEESINWVNSNIDEAAQLIVDYDILPDKEIAINSIPYCNLNYSQAWEAREGINEYFKVFYNFSPLILGGSLPDEDFYYKTADN